MRLCHGYSIRLLVDLLLKMGCCVFFVIACSDFKPNGGINNYKNCCLNNVAGYLGEQLRKKMRRTCSKFTGVAKPYVQMWLKKMCIKVSGAVWVVIYKYQVQY